MLFVSAVVMLSAGGLVFLAMASSSTRAGSKSDPMGNAAPRGAIADKPLASYQIDLLETAFVAASKFPIRPHIATRSKEQEDVVAACFQLDQPRRALDHIEQIEDWRRGKGYADYALYCAQHGDTSEVQHYMDLAFKVARSTASDVDSQYWQVDRIKVSMAKVNLALGDAQGAARLEAGTADSEAERMEVAKAAMLGPEAFDFEFSLIDNTISKGNFDQTKSALETAVQLYKKFYDDNDRRLLLETKVETSWGKLPLEIRVGLMTELADAALGHDDRKKALEIADQIRALVENSRWLPEDRIRFIARLAALRQRAGDSHAASAEAEEALATFDAERDKIPSMNRADVLRPLAETYQSMRDTKTSLAIYKRAIEEGCVNPNSRPRAVDLCATCCSMASQAVEPDAELRARIAEICDGLKDPW